MQSHNTQSLWTALRAMFALMHRSIGAVSALAERAWIEPSEWRRIRAWFAPVLAMARKVVLIEALVLARDAVLAPRRLRSARAVPNPPRQHKPNIRLWPKLKRLRARVRQLGPPTSCATSGAIKRVKRKRAILRTCAPCAHRRASHSRAASKRLRS
jgi:hypothetical protein